jgi:hypothetical protein
MQRLDGILKRFVHDYGLEGGLTLHEIKKQWADIIGHPLAAHTFPYSLKNRTIIIGVDTPQWMHHVSFYKHEILGRLRPYEVTAVRFKLYREPKDTGKRRETRKARQLTDNDYQFIEHAIKDMKSDTLRRKLRSLLSNAMKYKKNV